MQTYMANPDKIERKWYVVDADGCTLGRLASGVASVLRGKNKPQFTPHVDTGDYVIIVNADKIKVTGKNFALANVFYLLIKMLKLLVSELHVCVPVLHIRKVLCTCFFLKVLLEAYL